MVGLEDFVHTTEQGYICIHIDLLISYIHTYYVYIGCNGFSMTSSYVSFLSIVSCGMCRGQPGL
jgi:hypothetical protein